MRCWLTGLAAAVLAISPATAQMRTIDPNTAIDGDLAPGPAPTQAPEPAPGPAQEPGPAPQPEPAQQPDPLAPPPPPPPPSAAGAADASANRRAETARRAEETYAREDLMAAGEGVFGKGAAGLAGILEDILSKQGRPNAYIAGREAAGAFVVGLRYGSGVMSHKVEGQQPVYWTGPSIGFDFGGDADKVFVLVYNLYDTAELYKRFPGGEGRLYAVGGFAASYLRRGDVVLIPIRLGVGWRAGLNVGYMNFTQKSRWLPF